MGRSTAGRPPNRPPTSPVEPPAGPAARRTRQQHHALADEAAAAQHARAAIKVLVKGEAMEGNWPRRATAAAAAMQRGHQGPGRPPPPGKRLRRWWAAAAQAAARAASQRAANLRCPPAMACAPARHTGSTCKAVGLAWRQGRAGGGGRRPPARPQGAAAGPLAPLPSASGASAALRRAAPRCGRDSPGGGAHKARANSSARRRMASRSVLGEGVPLRAAAGLQASCSATAANGQLAAPTRMHCRVHC